MRRRRVGILVLLGLVLMLPACQKITQQTGAPGGLPGEKLASDDSIPKEWGSLVAVSNAALYPELLQLWFQDSEGTIRMAVLSLPTGKLVSPKVIRRR